jgi:calcineurin-like phosphoesterase family protein
LEGFAGNIHGHIHKQGDMEGLGKYNPPSLDSTKYYNVNTEFHNYTPIPFEEIEKHFKKE